MENLPEISIKYLKISGVEFLKRIKKLILSEKNLKNLFNCDLFCDLIYPTLVLNIKPKYSTKHKNLCGQIIVHPNLPHIKGVQLKDLFDIVHNRFPNQTKYDDKASDIIFYFYPESEEWYFVFKEEKISDIKIDLRPLHPEKNACPFYEMKEINKFLEEILEELKEIKIKEGNEVEIEIKWLPGNDKKINIGLRAEEWSFILTYKTYVEEAEKLFTSIIETYSQKYKTNLKLDIKPLKPKIQFPFTLEYLFTQFMHLANKSVLHPLDWERFYKFIRACHYHKFKDEELLRNRLIQGGFSEEYADEVVNIFEHSYKILSTPVPTITTSLSLYYWGKIRNIIDPISKQEKIYINVEVKAKVKKNKVELNLKCFPDDPFLREKILVEIKRICPEIISIKFV